MEFCGWTNGTIATRLNFLINALQIRHNQQHGNDNQNKNGRLDRVDSFPLITQILSWCKSSVIQPTEQQELWLPWETTAAVLWYIWRRGCNNVFSLRPTRYCCCYDCFHSSTSTFSPYHIGQSQVWPSIPWFFHFYLLTTVHDLIQNIHISI